MNNLKTKKIKGSVLILAMTFSFILATVGTAFIYMNGMEEQFSNAEVNQSRALYLAEAGLARAVSYLNSAPLIQQGILFGGQVNLEPPTQSSSISGSYYVSLTTITLGGAVNYWPYDPNTVSVIIVSSGTVGGKYQKVVRTRIDCRNRMRHAWATDNEGLSQYPIYMHSSDYIHGWVRSNDKLYSNGIVFGNGDPNIGGSFNDPNTSWCKMDEGEIVKYYIEPGISDGLADMHWFDELDEDSLQQSNLKEQNYPKEKINYFENIDLDELKDLAQRAQNVDGIQRVFEGDRRIFIGTDYLKVGNSSTYDITGSTPIFFIDGNITELQSDNNKKLTRAIVVVARGNITINGDINYDDNAPAPPTHPNITGGGPALIISGRDIRIRPKADPLESFEIDAYLMAMSTFTVLNYKNVAPVEQQMAPPLLKIWGGVIMNYRGVVGQASSVKGSMIDYGYQKMIAYDERVLLDTLMTPLIVNMRYEKLSRTEDPLEILK
jgi:hypothetical protein